MSTKRKRSSLLNFRARLALVFAAVGALLMASGLVVLSASSATAVAEIHKSYVCKYVSTPDGGERLQTGDNPIFVDNHAIKGYDGKSPVKNGDVFVDGHNKSVVLYANTGEMDPEPTIDQCPGYTPPEGDKLTIPDHQAPTAPSCSAPGSYSLPEDGQGIDWEISPTYTSGATGTFTVTATALNGKTFTDDTKSKTWTVNVLPQLQNCTDIPPAPQPVAPTCTAAGSFSMPANTAEVEWSINPTYHGVGTYTVTATPKVGNFSDGTSSKEFSITVAPQLPKAQCPDELPDEVITPAAPEFENPTCENLDGASAVFADTASVDYSITGTPGLGQAVTVTAVPKSGFAFPAGFNASWSHQFPSITALDCEEVKGTETAKPKPDKPEVDKPGKTERPAVVLGTQAAVPTNVDAGLGTVSTASSSTMRTLLAPTLLAAGLLMLVTGGCIGLGRRTRGVHEA